MDSSSIPSMPSIHTARPSTADASTVASSVLSSFSPPPSNITPPDLSSNTLRDSHCRSPAPASIRIGPAGQHAITISLKSPTTPTPSPPKSPPPSKRATTPNSSIRQKSLSLLNDPICQSLTQLSPHLPFTTLTHLLSFYPSEVPPTPPYSIPTSATPTPLLFLDISGFTKMSTLLPVNDLSIVINQYFTALLTIVSKYGGDVLKFAGDAIFCIFTHHDLDAAVLCGTEVVQKLSNWSPPQHATLDSVLNVHCGLAYDTYSLTVVSVPFNNVNTLDGQTGRSELLLYGPAIEAVATAEGLAGLGMVHCCPATVEHYGLESTLIAEVGGACFITPSDATVTLVKEMAASPFRSAKFSMGEKLRTLTPRTRKALLAEIKEFVHEVVVKRGVSVKPRRASGVSAHGVAQPVDEQLSMLQKESELRGVYTVFIMVEGIDWSGDVTDILQYIMTEVGGSCSNFSGTLRQFIVDDKGVVLIVNFGLPGFTVQNLAERVVSFVLAVTANLAAFGGTKKQLVSLKTRVGVTYGEVYCGIVGGVSRHEYAVMGPSVNLAARLMCIKPKDDGIKTQIVTDERVRDQASGLNHEASDFKFQECEPVKAKGFDLPIKTFMPVSKHANRRGSVSFNVSGVATKGEIFCGRSSVIDDLLELAQKTLTPDGPSVITYIEGEGGIGKSALARHVLTLLPEFNCLQGYCDTTGGATPLAVFRRIFKTLWGNNDIELAKIADDVNYTNDKFTTAQLAFATLELFGLLPLGTDMAGTFLVPVTDIRVFVATLFKAYNSPTILIIDDAHHIDHESNLLLREIVKTCNGFFVMCTSRPTTPAPSIGSTNNNRIGSNSKTKSKIYDNDGEFDELRGLRTCRLTPLDETELLEFIHLTVDSHNPQNGTTETTPKLELQTSKFASDLFSISGGSPLFAKEIVTLALENELIKKVKSGTPRSNGTECIMWRNEVESDDERDAFVKKVSSFGSISELVLSKFDELSSVTQEFAGNCAVLGGVFDESDLILLGWSSAQIDECLRELDGQEIVMVDDEEEGDEEGAGACWRWRQQVWHSSVYNMMLSPTRTALHREIASNMKGEDIKTLTKCLHHWLKAEEGKEASLVGLTVGEWFSKRGLLASTLSVLTQCTALEKTGVGYLGIKIKVQIERAKCLATVGHKKASADAYKVALEMFEIGDEEGEVEDKSIVFPVISGILLALKWGAIEDDEDGTYERELVGKFIESARGYGDKGHISRAIALKGVMLQRMGKWEEAIEAQAELEEVYSAELSAGISKGYGSDRGAQSYPMSVQWMVLMDGACGVRAQEQKKKSVALIEHELMEERRNVHNKFMLVYPLVCVELEQGAEKGLGLWEKHLLEPFSEFYTSEGKVFFKSVYAPVNWLLRLKAGGGEEGAGEYLRECATGGHVVGGSNLLETVMVLLGRGFNSLVAELGVAWLRAGGGEGAEAVRGYVRKSLKECVEAAQGKKGWLWEMRACERLICELDSLS